MGLSHERMKIREAAASFVSKEYHRNYQGHASIFLIMNMRGTADLRGLIFRQD